MRTAPAAPPTTGGSAAQVRSQRPGYHRVGPGERGHRSVHPRGVPMMQHSSAPRPAAATGLRPSASRAGQSSPAAPASRRAPPDPGAERPGRRRARGYRPQPPIPGRGGRAAATAPGSASTRACRGGTASRSTSLMVPAHRSATARAAQRPRAEHRLGGDHPVQPAEPARMVGPFGSLQQPPVHQPSGEGTRRRTPGTAVASSSAGTCSAKGRSRWASGVSSTPRDGQHGSRALLPRRAVPDATDWRCHRGSTRTPRRSTTPRALLRWGCSGWVSERDALAAV